MRRAARALSNVAAFVLLSLAITDVISWWAAGAALYAGAALSSLVGALRRPDDPTATRLSSRPVRWQQAALRAIGWGFVAVSLFAERLPLVGFLPLLVVVMLERGYAGARNSDVLLYEDRILTESESVFSEDLVVSEIVGIEADSTTWSVKQTLIVVTNPSTRTPLLPCTEGSPQAERVLAWAREWNLAVPTLEA